jgi:hypothetical protein
MLPLEDSRLLKPAKSSVAAPSPLQTRPPSAPRVHSSSAPSSAYQAFRQGERDSYSTSKPKPAVHPHLPSGHISSSPRPAVKKESEWSPADEKLAIRRAQNTITPAKPTKPLVTKEDDARETRRFHNQVAAAPKPSSPPRVYPSNFIGPIAPGATRQPSPPKPESSKSRVYPANFIGPIALGARGPNSPRQPSEAPQRGDASPLPSPDELYGGTHRGSASGRSFTPGESGGPRLPLSTDRIRVKPGGIDRIESHVSRFGSDPKNEAQIKRLRDITEGKVTATDADRNFYAHELRESVRYKKLGYANGQPTNPDAASRLWNNTHSATLEDYALKEGPGVLYHPSVEEAGPQTSKPLGARGPKQSNIGAASATEGALRGGVAKGVLRGVSRAAIPVAAAVDAYDLTKTYQQDGFGPKFRSEAAGVAGGWGTAFAAGAAGTAICGPLCGIAAGAGGYFVGSGAASKLEEGAEELGKGAVEEGKKLWHKVFG